MRSAESTQGVELSDLIFLTSFGDIFRPLRPAFTTRSWPFAVMVAVAWILSAGRRTVTAFIRQTDGKRHWTLGYKFFSVFRWSEWTNAHLLLKKAREIFPLTPIVLVADDTRAGKTGPLIFGGGGFADPAAKPLRFLGAPNGVILGLSVYIPEWKRWYCFPRITRPSLRRKNCPKDGEFRTRLSLVEEMVQEVLGGLQEALSGLGVILVADGAYARKALRRVLKQRSVPRVSRLPWTAALYEAPRGAQAQDAGTQTPRGPPDAEALRARRGGRLQPDDRLDVRQGRHALGEELRGAVEASRGLGPRGHHEISGPAGPEASDRVLLLDGPRPDPAPDHLPGVGPVAHRTGDPGRPGPTPTLGPAVDPLRPAAPKPDRTLVLRPSSRAPSRRRGARVSAEGLVLLRGHAGSAATHDVGGPNFDARGALGHTPENSPGCPQAALEGKLTC